MMDTISMIDGRRQSVKPPRLRFAQNATASTYRTGVPESPCCHMSPVVLSVMVPFPLLVKLSGVGAPMATSPAPFAIGHSAQLGSAHAGGLMRSQTNPVEQAAGLPEHIPVLLQACAGVNVGFP